MKKTKISLCVWFAALFLSFLVVGYSVTIAEEFPDSDIQWILDQYQVSERKSLIPAEGLNGWTYKEGRKIPDKSKWSNKGGKLFLDFTDRSLSGGDIYTDKQYTNFILDFAWISGKRRGNNGIKYRMKDFGKTGAVHANDWLGCEYQILDEANFTGGRGSTASLYDVILPDKDKKKVNPFGELNTGRIIVLDNHIEHWLNGVKVMQVEVGSDAWKKGILDGKFSTDDGKSFGFGENPTGFIMITDHGDPISYEKMIIREIGTKK